MRSATSRWLSPSHWASRKAVRTLGLRRSSSAATCSSSSRTSSRISGEGASATGTWARASR